MNELFSLPLAGKLAVALGVIIVGLTIAGGLEVMLRDQPRWRWMFWTIIVLAIIDTVFVIIWRLSY